MDVQGRPARPGFQVSPRPAVEVQDIAAIVHDHRRGGVLREQPLLGECGYDRLFSRELSPLPLRYCGLCDYGRCIEPGCLRWGPLPTLEDLPPAIDRLEPGIKPTDRLSRTEEEKPARVQGILKEGYHLLLQFRREVYKEVAAGEDVEASKRGIREDVLRRKDHTLPDLLTHEVGVILLHEEALQSPGREISDDVRRVGTAPCDSDRPRIHIGRKNLDRIRSLKDIQAFPEKDGEAVSLLAGGAAHDPGPDRPSRLSCGEQVFEDLLFQHNPGARIPEEPGYPDQEVVCKDIDLLWVLVKECDVPPDTRDMVQGHPALDTPPDGVALVSGEILTGSQTDKREDPFQVSLHPGRGEHAACGIGGGELHVLDEQIGKFPGRSDVIHKPGSYRTPGHTAEPGRRRIFGHHHAHMLFDSPDPECSIASRPGEDDPHRPPSLVLSEVLEETVDGHPEATRPDRFQVPDGAMEDGEIGPGGFHVHCVRLDLHAVRGLPHGHPGEPLEDLRQVPSLSGIHMRDQHEGEPGVRWHAPEELLERLESARGCTDAHDRQRFVRLLLPVFIMLHGSLLSHLTRHRRHALPIPAIDPISPPPLQVLSCGAGQPVDILDGRR